ncbi:MAG: DUF3368 domain-containing protein [Limisphaerales bacterium]
MNRIVVSDSACLIGLERVQRLELLAAVFGEVIIPPMVAAEFGVSLPWLKVIAPRDLHLVAACRAVVDDGEAEAIALAAELGAEVLLDDLRGRRLAARLNVPARGLLGVLVLAKQMGKLVAVAPVISELRRQNFFISAPLVAEVLGRCGETMD